MFWGLFLLLLVLTFSTTNGNYHQSIFLPSPCTYNYCHETPIIFSSTLHILKVNYRVTSSDPYVIKYVLYEYDSDGELVLIDDDYDYFINIIGDNTVTSIIFQYSGENNMFIVSYKINSDNYIRRLTFDTNTKTFTTIDVVNIGSGSFSFPVKIMDGGDKIYSCVNDNIYMFENGAYNSIGSYGGYLNNICRNGVVVDGGVIVEDRTRALSSSYSGYVYFHPNDGNGGFQTTPLYTIPPPTDGSYNRNCGYGLAYFDGKIVIVCSSSSYTLYETSYLFPGKF